MRCLLDTNVAIDLRDGDPSTRERVALLADAPLLSILSRVELENGVYRSAKEAHLLRPRVDMMLNMMEQLPFTTREAEAYARIVERLGYARAKIIDRMIAAQAIVAGAVLATLNARDFRAIPDLRVEDWSA